MARGNYRDYLQGDQVKIKKYFYVLRPILACEWIELYGTMPPVEFQVLVDRLVPEGSELKQMIQNLLSRKIAGEELDYEARINPINEFLEERISYYERTASGKQASETADQDKRLDDLFRSALKEVWRESDK
ncbi:putative nucleotidyltransferase [compost metagenome]